MMRWSLSREVSGVKYQMHNVEVDGVLTLAEVLAGLDGSKLPSSAAGVIADAIDADGAVQVGVTDGGITIYPSEVDELAV